MVLRSERILDRFDKEPKKFEALVAKLQQIDATRNRARERVANVTQLLALAEEVITHLQLNPADIDWEMMTKLLREQDSILNNNSGEPMVEASLTIDNLVPVLQNPSEQKQYQQLETELNSLLAEMSLDQESANPQKILAVSTKFAELLSKKESGRFSFSPEALLVFSKLALGFINSFFDILATVPKLELAKNVNVVFQLTITKLFLNASVQALTEREVVDLWTEAEPTPFAGVRQAFEGSRDSFSAALSGLERAKIKLSRLITTVLLTFIISGLSSAYEDNRPTSLDQTLYSLVSEFLANNGATPEQRVEVLGMMHMVSNAAQDYLAQNGFDLTEISNQAEADTKLFLEGKGGDEAQQASENVETQAEIPYAVIEFQELPAAWYTLLDFIPEGGNRVIISTEAFPNDFSIANSNGGSTPLREIVGEAALTDESSPLARTLQGIIDLYTINHEGGAEVTTYPQSIELIVKNGENGSVEYILLGRIPDGRLVVINPDFTLTAGSVFSFENGAFTYLIPEMNNRADVINLNQRVSYEVVRSGGQRTSTSIALGDFLAQFPGFDEVMGRLAESGVENVLFEYGTMKINNVDYVVPFNVAAMGEAFATNPFVIDAQATANLREAPTTRAATTQFAAFDVAPTPAPRILKAEVEQSVNPVLNYSTEGNLTTVTVEGVTYAVEFSAEGAPYIDNEGYKWLIVINESDNSVYFMALLPSAGIDLVSRMKLSDFQGMPPFNPSSVIPPEAETGNNEENLGTGSEPIELDLSILPVGVRDNVPTSLTFEPIVGEGLQTLPIASVTQESANHFLLLNQDGGTIGMFRSDLNVLDGSDFNDGTVFMQGDSSQLRIETTNGAVLTPNIRVFFSQDMMSFASIDALQTYFDNHNYRTNVREEVSPGLLSGVSFGNSGDGIIPSQSEQNIANRLVPARFMNIHSPESGEEQISTMISIALEATGETEGLRVNDGFWRVENGIDLFVVGGVTDTQLQSMRGATGYPQSVWYQLNSETGKLEIYISNLSRSGVGQAWGLAGGFARLIDANYDNASLPNSDLELVDDLRIPLVQNGADGYLLPTFDISRPNQELILQN